MAQHIRTAGALQLLFALLRTGLVIADNGRPARAVGVGPGQAAPARYTRPLGSHQRL
ncbi:hypothetical protein [Streptomyces mirabilis]|uniref:hypothetical protein n=1 Tax=Streptomyces mirabilis TaxID=68239 RepID=UPI0033A09F6C